MALNRRQQQWAEQAAPGGGEQADDRDAASRAPRRLGSSGRAAVTLSVLFTAGMAASRLAGNPWPDAMMAGVGLSLLVGLPLALLAVLAGLIVSARNSRPSPLLEYGAALTMCFLLAAWIYLIASEMIRAMV